MKIQVFAREGKIPKLLWCWCWGGLLSFSCFLQPFPEVDAEDVLSAKLVHNPASHLTFVLVCPLFKESVPDADAEVAFGG